MTCSVPGCTSTRLRARGLCVSHYERQRRGVALGALPRLSLSTSTMEALLTEAEARRVSVDVVATEVLEDWGAKRVTR